MYLSTIFNENRKEGSQVHCLVCFSSLSSHVIYSISSFLWKELLGAATSGTHVGFSIACFIRGEVRGTISSSHTARALAITCRMTGIYSK